MQTRIGSLVAGNRTLEFLSTKQEKLSTEQLLSFPKRRRIFKTVQLRKRGKSGVLFVTGGIAVSLWQTVRTFGRPSSRLGAPPRP